MQGLFPMQFRALRRHLLAPLLLALGLFAAPLAVTGQGTSFNPALPLTHVDNGPNSAWAAEPALCRARLARRLPLGLRHPRQRHASACARQGGRVGAPRACCPAIRRSLFPITTPSSPAFIPNTTALWPTTFSIPRATRATPCTTSKPQTTVPGTAASRSGASQRARACARRAFCGSRARPKSPASCRLTTPPTTAKPRPRLKPSRRASTIRWRCSISPPPTVRISSPSTSPSPTTPVTSSAPTRARPAPPPSAWTPSSANSAPRSPPPACPSTSS